MIITGKKFSKPEMSRVKNGDLILDEKKKKENRIRLDLLLVEKYPDFNRSTLQNFIKSGYVTVNGEVIKKPNYSVLLSTEENGAIFEANPEIVCNIPKHETPTDLKNYLIYEDDNVLVVNKPAGMLSMAKGEFTTENTLEDYGLLVHRLDRDTSGVVILAKNEATQTMLRNQFQARKTKKTYIAIVEGKPKLESAMIDLPIARNLKKPTTFIVDPNGKPSQTQYRILLAGKDSMHHKDISLLELKPQTGRTHQLRVHLAYLNCPILGDKVYGDGKYNRLYLHAYSLEITIPGKENGERKTFSAKVPEDFYSIMNLDKNTYQILGDN